MTLVKQCNALPAIFPDAQLVGTGPTCADNLNAAVASDNTQTLCIPGPNHDEATVANCLPFGTVGGDSNFASVVTFVPGTSAITNGDANAIGTKMGGGSNLAVIGIANGPCTSPIGVDFIFYNIALPNMSGGANPANSSNIAYPRNEGQPHRTAAWNVGSPPVDGGADTIVPDGTGLKAAAVNFAPGGTVAGYPSYLLNLFPGSASTPRSAGGGLIAVYGGVTYIAGEWIPLFFVQFAAGALAALPKAPESLMTTAMGQPNVAVLNDPMPTMASRSAITDFCSALLSINMLSGKGYLPGDAAGAPTGPVRALSPTAGTGLFQQYDSSYRDLDQDGIENELDTCPTQINAGNARALGDSPLNGIDNVCRPATGNCSTASANCDEDTPYTPAVTLTANINAIVTTIPVSTPNTIANGDHIVIGPQTSGHGEHMWVTAGGGTASLTVVRAYDDTVDAQIPHTNGTAITQGDGLDNRQDNCPLVANGANLDGSSNVSQTDKGPRTDGIGNACESGSITITQNGHAVTIDLTNPAVAHGRYLAKVNVVPKCFGAGAAYSPAQTLSGAINSSVTSITVSGTPPTPPAILNGDVLIIDSEHLAVTAGQGTTSLTVVRGVEGTTAAAHLINAPITRTGSADLDHDGYCASDMDTGTDSNTTANKSKHKSWVTITALNTTGTSADSDGDGFSDAQETYMGTDATKRCAQTPVPPVVTGGVGDEGPLDNWPFDFDDNRQAALSDVLAYGAGGPTGPVFNHLADSAYYRRYDLDQTGYVDLGDVLAFGGAPFNARCTYTAPFQQ